MLYALARYLTPRTKQIAFYCPVNIITLVHSSSLVAGRFKML